MHFGATDIRGGSEKPSNLNDIICECPLGLRTLGTIRIQVKRPDFRDHS